MQDEDGLKGSELWKNVSALSDVIFWEVADGRLAYISDGISSLLGLSPEKLLDDPAPWLNRIYTRHRGRHRRAVESSREHGAYVDVEYRARIPRHGTTWLRDHLMFEPESGRLFGITTLVSPQHEVQERLGFLNKAAKLLSSSLEAGELLEGLASHMAGSLADICIIELQRDDQVDAFVRSDRSKRLDNALTAAGPMLLDGRPVPARLKQGRAVLIEKLTVAQLRKLCGAKRVEAFGRRKPHSAILLPLYVTKRLLGTVTLLCADPDRDYIPQDVDLALDVCNQAAIALDHARLFELARRSQDDLSTENEMKDEFLALISHELRTPLTVIYGVSRLMPRIVTAVDEDAQQMIDDLRSASERTVGLVDDLMLLARLNLGQSPELEPVAVAPFLREITADFTRQYPNRELVIDDRCKETVMGSAPYLRQVILNLLSNAHKYSPQDAVVSLGAEASREEIVFSVIDSGKGVPAAELPHIFDRFYRGSSSTGVSGAGMGLAICRRLVEAQNGRIWAEPGKHSGLCVRFSLPRA